MLAPTATLKAEPAEEPAGDVIAARRPEVSCQPRWVAAPRPAVPRSAAMDGACESPAEKAGETEVSDEAAAAPAGPGATDADGHPEEADADGDGDLKEAAAEEGEVGRRWRGRVNPEMVLWLRHRLPVSPPPAPAGTIGAHRVPPICSRGGGSGWAEAALEGWSGPGDPSTGFIFLIPALDC